MPAAIALVRAAAPWLLVGALAAQAPDPAAPPPIEEPPIEEPSPPAVVAPADDAQIEQRLRAAFARVDAFAGVDVSVGAGVVTLSGAAPTPTIRSELERIARALPGVLYVDNRVRLVTRDGADDVVTAQDERIAERLRAIFAQVERLAAVEVAVRAGVVTLRGETTPALRDRAEELARGVDGVLFVQNDVHESEDIQERLSPGLDKILGYGREFVLELPLIGIAILVVVAFWLLAGFVTRFRFPFGRVTRNRLLQGVLRQAVRTGVVLLGVFLALELLGATALVGAVLGTAGVVGLAVGFAFRDIVENYFASLILSVWRPFQAKDLVQVGDHTGAVVRMTTRETVLMTLDGNHVSLPNAMVFKSPILNFTRNPMRRFGVAVGVGVDTDLGRAQELGLQVLHDMPGVADDPPPLAQIEELGASTVNLRFYGWIDQRHADFLKVHSEATRRIKTVMDEHGIEMPVPIYQVNLERGREPAPEPPARPRVPVAGGAAVDVSVQHDIGRQIDAERAQTPDSDLLTNDGGGAGEPPA